MLLLIAAWRKTQAFQTFSLVANYGLILMGGLLFLMQMHGYEHTANPEEFIVSTESSAPRASSEMVSSNAIVQPTRQDSISITIPARSDIEYKLQMEKGATLEYAWETNGTELFFDFHGEPAGDTTGYFESFKKSIDSQSNGSLTTSFEGPHGWYWKNDTPSPVIIELKVTGAYRRLDLNKVPQQTETKQPLIPTTHDSID